jgi:Fe-S-cluster containining protein
MGQFMMKYYKHNNIDCGNCPVGQFCCTLKVKLSLFDRLKIFIFEGLRVREYADKLMTQKGWGIKLENGDCHFLKRDGEKAWCSIYKSRPSVCRQFPHFFEQVNDCRDIVKKWKGVRTRFSGKSDVDNASAAEPVER